MAKQEEMGLLQFKNRFADEKSCREHLFHIRWPNGSVSPKCGHTECFTNRTRNTYQCKACNHQTSVTAGTTMDKTHLKLSIWFWTIYIGSCLWPQLPVEPSMLLFNFIKS